VANSQSDIYECQVCGKTFTRWELEEFSYKSLRGIFGLSPGDCSPDEWKDFCPECEAFEELELLKEKP